MDGKAKSACSLYREENSILNQIAVQVFKIIFLPVLNINSNCSHPIKFQFYSYCLIWVRARKVGGRIRSIADILSRGGWRRGGERGRILLGNQWRNLKFIQIVMKFYLHRYSLLNFLAGGYGTAATSPN